MPETCRADYKCNKPFSSIWLVFFSKHTLNSCCRWSNEKHYFTGRRKIVQSHFLIFCGATTQLGSAAPLLWFLDYRNTHTHTFGRTALHEWSACRRGRYLYKTQQTQEANIQPLKGFQTQNPSNQTAADLRLRPHGHLDRRRRTYYRVIQNDCRGTIVQRQFRTKFGKHPPSDSSIRRWYAQFTCKVGNKNLESCSIK